MCGKLYRSEAQTVKSPEQINIPIQVPGAFKIEESCHFALLVNSLDIRSIKRKFDLGMILFDLIQGKIHHTKGVFYLEPSGIIVFRCINGEKHRVHAALSGSWQINIPVCVTLPDISSHQQFTSHNMRMPVHHKCFAMQVRHRLILEI